MALVRIPEENRTIEDDSSIAAFLAERGIEYERWTGGPDVASGATSDGVLAAYAGKIDELKAHDADMTKRLAALDGTAKGLAADVGQLKQMEGPISQQIQTLSPRLDALDAAVKELQAKATAAPAKGGKKRR